MGKNKKLQKAASSWCYKNERMNKKLLKLYKNAKEIDSFLISKTGKKKT